MYFRIVSGFASKCLYVIAILPVSILSYFDLIVLLAVQIEHLIYLEQTSSDFILLLRNLLKEICLLSKQYIYECYFYLEELESYKMIVKFITELRCFCLQIYLFLETLISRMSVIIPMKILCSCF